MQKSVYIPPPRTLLEVYQSLPEGTSAQLINNHIYMSPALVSTHQIVLAKIFSQLFNFVEENKLGQSLVAPFDVFFNRKNVFQPDIVFISKKNMHQLKQRGFYGAPDLIIEILSPATWRFDKEDKYDVYESCGVKEYWMIDPVDKIAKGFTLKGNQFSVLPPQTAELTLQLLPLTIRF